MAYGWDYGAIKEQWIGYVSRFFHYWTELHTSWISCIKYSQMNDVTMK